ncbi:DNA cytosine methyltransferase [Gammaproteobacteria bacterium]|nr:DNA cytosine methyltransferase [Gammaproteobacteria bacterium]
MNHIELFAGCGGLSLGLETAGFDLLLANEISPMASETFAYNHLNADLTLERNIEKIYWISSEKKRCEMSSRLRENPMTATGLRDNHYSDVKEREFSAADLDRSLLVGSIVDLNTLLDENNTLLKHLKSGLGAQGVDLVSGGPPCQSFSLAGLRQHSNERNQLPWEFAKFVEKTQPKIALLENVSGILRAFKLGNSKYYAWFEVAKAFAKVGYIPICLHVNAKYVGTAQNRPRFILLAIREDMFKKFKNTSLAQEVFTRLSPFHEFFEKIYYEKRVPKIGEIDYIDINKDREIFSSELFKSLITHQEQELVSVKDAIDDLRSEKIVESEYVKRINSVYKKHHKHQLNSSKNHDPRSNNNRVKSRFRIYQVMNKLPKSQVREISNFLRTGGATDVKNNTLQNMHKYWLLNTEGEKINSPSKKQILEILGQLYTKKQTQKALIAKYPAPAALSIPDDACHYHESVKEQRTLTVREMSRIQSFPDWYEIKSKVTTGGQMRKFEVPQYTQIGNAVPPLLGIALGKMCKKIISV